MGLFDFLGSGITSAAQVGIAKMQMNFQERMSNTAYQRTMKDMRLAGLNPLLAAKVGGASTPPGASALISDPVAAMRAGGVKEEEKKRTLEDVKLRQEDRKLREAQINTAVQTARLVKDQATTERFKAAHYSAGFNKTWAETDLLKTRLPGALFEQYMDETRAGKAARMIGRGLPAIGAITTAVGGAAIARRFLAKPRTPRMGQQSKRNRKR